MVKRRLSQFSPSKFIFLSIFFTILIGTLLLALPMSRTQPVAFLDLFFTATSATCVTGLFATPMSSFTTFGHTVILGLIQVGGLGLITLTLFVLYLFMNLGLATQLMAGKLLDMESWTSVKKLLYFIIGFTLFCEVSGALVMFSAFRHLYDTPYAWFLSFFYSISSFCSAGMPLLPDNMEAYQANYTILSVMTILMFLGGLGFVTLFEIKDYFFSRVNTKRHIFSLHSRINLSVTAITIATCAALICFLEWNNAFSGMSPSLKTVTTLFHALSFRSTGWASVPIFSLQRATIFLMMVSTFIGASPGSTGSGIKMVALAIYLATIKSAIFGQSYVNIKGRMIAREQINQVFSIVSLSIIWIILCSFALLITEQGWHLFQMLFEVVSAFATLGISLSAQTMSPFGKILIIVTMLIGRIGSLTLVWALRAMTLRKKAGAVEAQYPVERVILS